MIKLQITKIILFVTEKIKPILLKLIPITILRKVKKKLIISSVNNLNALSIKPFDRDKNIDGVNLIGYIKAEIGLGQSCRLVADALDASHVEFTVFNYWQASNLSYTDTTWDCKISNTLPFNINLIHINPYELPLACLQLPQGFLDYRYNIAFWLWELEEFPEDWTNAFQLVNEIWTPSEFAMESIRKKTNLPVKVIPYPISAPTSDLFNRAYFKLPENLFLYLCMYDCSSTIERKNPLGAIEAFIHAFSSDNKNVGLVIKINNVQQKDLDIINTKLDDYKNIFIITDIMKKVEVNSLIKCVDVYVSLHRAEGFGLVPAEAMLLGTPTIATNWSSNTEFMNSEVACMVDYSFVTIDKECGAYRIGNRWADPHIDHAAMYMQKLFEDKNFYDSIAIKGAMYIQDKLSKERASTLMNERIKEIYSENTISL